MDISALICRKVEWMEESQTFNLFNVGRNLGVSKLPAVGNICVIAEVTMNSDEWAAPHSFEFKLLDPEGLGIAQLSALSSAVDDPLHGYRSVLMHREFRQVVLPRAGAYSVEIECDGRLVKHLHVEVDLMSEYS
jgi:hypothetical protein